MSKNEKTPAADAPAEVKRAQQSIPVKSLSTKAGASVDFPGKHGSQSVTWTRKGTENGWEIHYFPGLRHHRVVYYRDGKPDTAMIHETWVSWRPLEEPEPAAKEPAAEGGA